MINLKDVISSDLRSKDDIIYKNEKNIYKN